MAEIALPPWPHNVWIAASLDQGQLEKEVLAWARARNQARKTVQWTFSYANAGTRKTQKQVIS